MWESIRFLCTCTVGFPAAKTALESPPHEERQVCDQARNCEEQVCQVQEAEEVRKLPGSPVAHVVGCGSCKTIVCKVARHYILRCLGFQGFLFGWVVSGLGA